MLAIVQKDYLINLHLEFMCKSCIHAPVCLVITRQTCSNVSKYAIVTIKAITAAESKFSPSTFKVLLC